MPEGINHYITNHGIGLTFTPNLALPSVPLIKTGLPLLGQTSALQYFALGESVSIEGINFTLPYQFGQAEVGPISVRLGWIDKNTNNGNLDEFGSTGTLHLPDFNQEFSIENHIKTPSTADSPWGIRILAIVGWVNMLNTPAVLNTVAQRSRVYLKVRHYFNQIS